jgi:DNA repair protein RecO (recombination protein O)
MVTEKVLILRKVRFGEADLILTCLTQHGRVMGLIAKSALKSKKRFGGGILEPTHYLNITYTPAPPESDKLATLNEAALLQDFKTLRDDYEKLDFALHVVKTVAHVSNDGEVHSKKLFDLVGNTLTVAQASKRLPWLRTQFEVKFLHQQGVLPPESTFQQLMATQLKDHEKLDLSDDEWSTIRARLRYCLESYLS